MAKYINSEFLDGVLQLLAECDLLSVCTTMQPTTYFNAVWPPLWVASTVYSLGDLVHPPDNNGFIYECVAAGTSGATEPVWAILQDDEFTDGTVTWKCHENYSLIQTGLDAGDFTITDQGSGKRLMVAPKPGIVSHAAGTVGHFALLCTTDQTLRVVSTAETSIAENNDVEMGRLSWTDAFYIDQGGIT